MKIVLATHNHDKEIELQHSLRGLGVEICSLSEYPDISEIEETGTTLLENSLLKAHTVHDRTGLPAITLNSVIPSPKTPESWSVWTSATYRLFW